MTLEPEQLGAQKFLSSAKYDVLGSLSFEGEDRRTLAVEKTRWRTDAILTMKINSFQSR